MYLNGFFVGDSEYYLNYFIAPKSYFLKRITGLDIFYNLLNDGVLKMTIKKTTLTSSMILALGLSLPLFAASDADAPKIVDGDGIVIECIPQLEVDAMNPTDKEKLTIPICEDINQAMPKEGDAPAQ